MILLDLFKKQHIVNIHQIGEKLSNLVTLPLFLFEKMDLSSDFSVQITCRSTKQKKIVSEASI
jgi:hypothetical protein